MVEGEEGKPIASTVEKIAKECETAGCNAWTITKVIKELSKGENVSESTLRKKALNILNTLDPDSARVYASFQRMLVRTSKQTIEHFDRGNIIRSLLKETDVTRGVAEKIGHEVEEKIKDLEISSISTALIRELVSVKLLEYGHENIRNQYARLGLPVSDVKKKIRHGPYQCKDVLIDFNLLRVIPKKFGDMHLRSDIFIASLEDFSTKPISYCHCFEQKENINETIFGNLKKMNRISKLVSWPVNAAHINTALVTGLQRRTLKKGIELFTNAFESVFPHRHNIPRNLGIDLFVPEEFEGIDRSLLQASANTFLKERERLGATNNIPVLSLDTKYKLKLVGKSQLEGTILLNCGEKALMPLNGIASEKNLCGMFGLNIPKYAVKGNEQEFFENLKNAMTAIKELGNMKKAILSKKEWLSKAGINPKEMHNAIGLYGLVVGASEITGGNEREITKFAEKIVSIVSKELENEFTITELLNKAGILRFEAENQNGENRRMAQTMLSKSSAILNKMQFIVEAENKKEINRLLEKDVTLIKA